MEELKEKVEACFKRLQSLDIAPTLNNMEKLVKTLYELRDVYNELERMRAENERSTSDNE